MKFEVKNQNVDENDGFNSSLDMESVPFAGDILFEKGIIMENIEFKIGMTFTGRFVVRKAIKYYKIWHGKQ